MGNRKEDEETPSKRSSLQGGGQRTRESLAAGMPFEIYIMLSSRVEPELQLPDRRKKANLVAKPWKGHLYEGPTLSGAEGASKAFPP